MRGLLTVVERKRGRHRHVTLAMLVHAYLAADRLPPTLPETRPLLAARVGLPPPAAAAVLRWSVRRRRHQQRVKTHPLATADPNGQTANRKA